MRTVIAISFAMTCACAPARRSSSLDTTAESTPTAPAPGIRESDVRALLAAWLAAQNQGDFQAYERLYAESFVGVRRTGPQRFPFDRAGWLADRRRMFGRAMRVEASDAKVATAERTAILTFDQRWESGSYRDHGPKQIVVVRVESPSGPALRIGREEMLGSTVVPAANAPRPLPPGSFYFVVLADGGRPWVLLHDDPDESWASGPKSLALRDWPTLVRANVRPGALPARWSAFGGRAIRLYGAEGPVCTGRIGAIAVLKGAHGAYGLREPGHAQERREMDAAAIEEGWSLGMAFLGGEVVTQQGNCAQARWARSTDLPEPTIWAPIVGRSEWPAGAVERFRSLPAHRAIQRQFRESPESIGFWDGLPGSEVTQVTVWRAPGATTARSIVTVSAQYFRDCGSFFGALWAVFEPVGSDLVLRTDRDDPGYYVPSAVFDADGDGEPEILASGGILGSGYHPYEMTLVRAVGATFRVVEHFGFLNMICRC